MTFYIIYVNFLLEMYFQPRGERKMTRADELRKFWADLSELLNDDLPLLRCLNILSNFGGDQFNEVIKQMATELQGGGVFSEAMGKTCFFTPIEINLIRAGEIGGIVESAVEKIAKNDKVLTRSRQLDMFWESLGVLIDGGVPVQQSIKLAAQIFDSETKIKEEIMRIYESVKFGNTMTRAMSTSLLFSEHDVDIIYTGETTGFIVEAMGKLT